MAWNGDLHDWEQNQWNGIEPILQPAVRAVVEVEDEGSNEVSDEREDEEIANEALLLVDVALPAIS